MTTTNRFKELKLGYPVSSINARRILAERLKPIIALMDELAHNAGAYSPKRYSNYLPKKCVTHRQTTIIVQL